VSFLAAANLNAEGKHSSTPTTERPQNYVVKKKKNRKRTLGTKQYEYEAQRAWWIIKAMKAETQVLLFGGLTRVTTNTETMNRKDELATKLILSYSTNISADL
jgi:hypothetical protein